MKPNIYLLTLFVCSNASQAGVDPLLHSDNLFTNIIAIIILIALIFFSAK